MKKKFIWILASCMLALSLVLASCGGGEEETVTEEPVTEEQTEEPTEEQVTEEPVTPGGGNWWDVYGEPQYGNRITIRESRNPTVGAWDGYWGASLLGPEWQETLLGRDITVDPDVYAFPLRIPTPEYFIGLLAESYEQPDLQTIIFHIRDGVYWHDMPPVNGRAFTAYDVEYHYHRILGLGSGFTEPSPFVNLWQMDVIDSVTATDKHTVVFKSNEPSIELAAGLLDIYANAGRIISREVVEEYGGSQTDWKGAVGTGPFMVTDYVEASALTLKKNPNYYGYDERYPENKLPYVDEIKHLIIPDLSTALAALRTGKIDIMEGLAWEHASNLARTNPELLKVDVPVMTSPAVGMRLDVAPFNDIKVRKALEMAIDRKTIAESLFGGNVPAIYAGHVSTAINGCYYPYEEWPKELQDEYAYNPEGAKELLAEAGYPNGFGTNIVLSSATNLDLFQIVQAYFADIGVDMEIRVMEPTVYSSYVRGGKHDQMFMGSFAKAYHYLVIPRGYLTDSRTDYSNFDNPVYDQMVYDIEASLSDEEQRRKIKDIDLYLTKQHVVITTVPTLSTTFYQPYLMGGYVGQAQLMGVELARFWIDQDMKESMGR